MPAFFFFLAIVFVVIYVRTKFHRDNDKAPFDTPRRGQRPLSAMAGRLIRPIPLRLRSAMMKTEDIDRALHWMNYYRKLTPQGKQEFCTRVREFMQSKEFTGMQGMELTFDIAVSVSAAAVQLTFGLANYKLSHFHTIRIFPEAFYSKINRNYLKGGASESGVVFLSWKDFTEGYRQDTDTFNLGLHEFAHALKINLTQGSDFDEEFAHYFAELENESSPVIDSIRRGEHNFLRKYGGTNKHEFFAVCAEHFFEVPELFRDKLPGLYHRFCLLLNQDPSEASRDYRLPSHLSSARVIDRSLWQKMKNYQYASWHWSLTVLLAGIFATPYFFFALLPQVALSSPYLWLIYAALVGTGAAVHYRKIVGQKVLNKTKFAAYLLLGFAPVVMVALLSVNRLVPLPFRTNEDYRLTGTVMLKNDGDYIVELEENAYSSNTRCSRSTNTIV